jgi:uncharacterized membrane protein (GlpM family)
MMELLLRFLIGGFVVSAFAVLADLLRPKSFAGLFSAAPSVAIATLSLTIHKQGADFAAREAGTMIAGAVAFLVSAILAIWLLGRKKQKSVVAGLVGMPVWLAVAFGLLALWNRVVAR